MIGKRAMAYDEKVYPNPEIFDPTRFLGEDQQMDPMKFIFGFGRRICPGTGFSRPRWSEAEHLDRNAFSGGDSLRKSN
jgi:cytochrome P450